MNEEISFIIEFDEMNEKQQNHLLDYLQKSKFKWHVLKGNDDFIENTNLKQALNEIREYVNSDKLLGRLCEPKINNKGETHFDLIRKDILQIIDKALGDEK